MATSKVSSFHLVTHLVELIPLEHIAEALVENICENISNANEKASFRTNCEKLIGEGQLDELVSQLVVAIGKAASESDINVTESRFENLISLGRNIPDVAIRIMKVLMSIPLRDQMDDKLMRLRVLKYLYSVVGAKPGSRYDILVQILNFSIAHSLSHVLEQTTVNDVEELCDMWASSPEDKTSKCKNLYRLFCDLAEKKRALGGVAKNDDLKEHRFLMKFLGTYEGANEQTLREVASYATRAAVISIKYPFPGDVATSSTLDDKLAEGFSSSFVSVLEADTKHYANTAILTATPSAALNYAAVQSLSGNPQHKTLYDLLHIFASNGITEYSEFTKKNPTFISSVGLSEEECLQNIRLLTLASLAANNETLTYQDVAKALHIEEAQVENWVIDAVMSKLIDAKMDQLHERIIINRGAQRLLSDEQWLMTQKKLASWKNSIREILVTIQNVQQKDHKHRN